MQIKRKMTRKGQLEVTPVELIVLVLVAIGLATVLVPMLAKYLSGETRGLDHGTRLTLDSFNQGVKALVGSNETECFIDFSLQSNTVFVGFGRTDDYLIESSVDRNFFKDLWHGPNAVAKPQSCSDKACIALCDVGGYLDWGDDDVNEDDCFNRPRARPFILEKINEINYEVNNYVHDLIIYSNIISFERLKLEKETASSTHYNIFVEKLEKTVTQAGDPIKPCRDLLKK
jgi:hypothetical protein